MTYLVTSKGIIHRLGPRNGSTSDPTASEQVRRIREWLLGILRFAVTLEQRDRAAVMCLAAEMDRLGASTTGFSYFTRTSTKLSDCIAAKDDFDKLAELCLYIEKIDDRRLRRALEGALFAKRNKSGRSRQPDREYLWKGLAVK
jgi:hypothetical protein